MPWPVLVAAGRFRPRSQQSHRHRVGKPDQAPSKTSECEEILVSDLFGDRERLARLVERGRVDRTGALGDRENVLVQQGVDEFACVKAPSQGHRNVGVTAPAGHAQTHSVQSPPPRGRGQWRLEDDAAAGEIAADEIDDRLCQSQCLP